MKRPELATKCRQNPTEDDLKAQKKQKDHCINLYKTERIKYHEALDISSLNDNEMFLKTIKPLFSKGSANRTLVEDEKLFTIDVAETLNHHHMAIPVVRT